MQIEGLLVEYRDINSIFPYKNNPKTHTDKQIRQIARSIKEFKFNNPILIDENNEIIGGHGRLLAAQKLGLNEVPVIQLKHLSEAQKRAYRIADNKLTENGKWDVDLLEIEFEELEKLNLDTSLDITGFETTEIDLMINDSFDGNFIDKKVNELPYVPKEETVSQSGDIWELGKHRIICGNALDQKTYTELFGEKKADMIFTDPPYNVRIKGHVSSSGKHEEFAMASGEMSQKEFQTFLFDNFKNLKSFSKDGSLHYICMDFRHIKEIMDAGNEAYDRFINLCVWNKDNGGMGSLYRSKHELIFIFKNGKKPHCNNIELGSNGRYRTNVWDYPGVNSISSRKEKLKMHPTVKPVEMIRDAILDVTKRGEVVLDSFLGSGSTLLAAEKCSRVCYGIEIEPLYIDTTIRRFQELTGEAAVHKQSGKTYQELVEVRRSNKEGKNVG